jgi:hypothetical protein
MSNIPRTEIEQAAARMKSYTGSAVLVFFLYWLLYFPGLIVNYLYYQEAKKMERLAGQGLPGVGCLTAMLWINVIAFALGILGFCVLMIIIAIIGAQSGNS